MFGKNLIGYFKHFLFIKHYICFQECDSSQDKKGWDKGGGANGKFTNGSGAESPKPSRKRFGSSSEEQVPKTNGVPEGQNLICSDLETLKQDIIKEMKKEINKVKQEIIDGNN